MECHWIHTMVEAGVRLVGIEGTIIVHGILIEMIDNSIMIINSIEEIVPEKTFVETMIEKDAIKTILMERRIPQSTRDHRIHTATQSQDWKGISLEERFDVTTIGKTTDFVIEIGVSRLPVKRDDDQIERNVNTTRSTTKIENVIRNIGVGTGKEDIEGAEVVAEVIMTMMMTIEDEEKGAETRDIGMMMITIVVDESTMVNTETSPHIVIIIKSVVVMIHQTVETSIVKVKI